MAREHARLWLDINSDDDFESLPFDAQGLYTRVILTLPDLSYAGVADWKPPKLTTKAPDLTLDRIVTAAAHLEAGRYCLFDLQTEEVLARSFIRRDELLRNPTMAAAVVKAYSGIASKVLRAAVITEIRRVHAEHPEYSSWTAMIKGYDVGAALSKLLVKPCLDEVPYTNQLTAPIGNTDAVPITNTESVTNSNPGTVRNPVSIGNTKSVANPCTYTSTLTPAPQGGGYVSGERHQSAHPDAPPPPPNRFCEEHPAGTKNPCRGCEGARKEFEAWERDRDIAEAARRAEIRTAIDACPDCSPSGQLDDQSDCPKHPNFRQEAANA